MLILTKDYNPVFYLNQFETIEYKSLNVLALWIICCFAGTCTCFINTTTWHLILGSDIDDKLSFVLHYLGLISCIFYQLCIFYVALDLDPDNSYYWYISVSIFWQLNYNFYLIMFMKQSSVWFGKLYFKISAAVIFIMNAAIIVDSYYFIRLTTAPTDNIIYISSKFDFGVTTGVSVIELIYNVATIYKIVKEAYKGCNANVRILIIKLVGVIMLFFIADLTMSAVYGLIDEFYSVSLCGFLIALKLQTEYFCLSRIRQCIIIVQNYENY
jgi:hypothetical protein